MKSTAKSEAFNTRGKSGRQCLIIWVYTGEYDYRSSGSYIKSAELETDCGKTATWTRDNRIGKLFQQYERQKVPMGMDFYIECPYCHKILNIVNPFDDGETWRRE